MAQIRLKQLNGLNNALNKDPIQVIFTSSQTYTIPSGYRSMDIFLVGGGGGGAGAISIQSSSPRGYGGDGGGGGYTTTNTLVKVNNRQVISVNIGAGGSGGQGGYSTSSNIFSANGGETNITINAVTYKALGGYGVHLYRSSDDRSTYTSSGGSGGATGGYTWREGGGDRRSAEGQNAGSNGANGSAYNNLYPFRYIGQNINTQAFGLSTEAIYSPGGGGGRFGYKTADSATVFYYDGGNAGSATGVTGNTGGGGKGGDGFSNEGGGTTPITHADSGSAGIAGIAIIRLYSNNKRPSVIWNSNNTINL